MLQFWKKSGQKERTDKLSPRSSPSKSPKYDPSPTISNGDISVTCVEGSGPYISGPLAGLNEEELDNGEPEDPQKPRTRSRLSKTLAEVLADKGALGYFIQFLQACEVVSLVKFWLDAESFRLATQATASSRPLSCCLRVMPEQLEEHLCAENLCKTCIGAKSLLDNRLEYSSPVRLGYTSCKNPKLDKNQVEQVQPFSGHQSSNSSSVIKTMVEHCVPNCAITAVNETKLPHNFSDVGAYDSGLPAAEPVVLEHLPRLSAAVQDGELPNGRWTEDCRSSLLRCPSCNDVCFSVNDAIRIYRKYISLNALLPVPLPEEVRSRVVAKICREDGLDPACFAEAQQEVYNLMDKEYFNDFLCSEFHCKHQIDVLTSGEVMLADILYNDTALFYFMEFMEQEGQCGLLEFWLAAVNFQHHLLEKGESYDPIEAQNDAMILYDKYFSLQATCPLGFSAKVRVAVEHNICRVDGPLPDCFQRPVDIVIHVLEKTYLQPFLTSQLYFRYLSELINTIQANPPLLSHNRKTGSECSSELSISTQNTLLAMEDPVPTRRQLRNLHDKDMRIDSRQLYDPDSLWRRRHQSGLSFGRINELGRFETDFEPEPGKKGENRITKVMKKLVHMEEDKAKEELAWQIAEKIVKDITSMTLGGQDSLQS